MNDEFQPRKILVIRFSSLGDVVLSTAVLPNLKARFPEASISVLTKALYAPLFENNPSVDQVLVFDPQKKPFAQLIREMRENRFDIILDLHQNFRSWLIRFFSGPPIGMTLHKYNWARRKLILFKEASPQLIPSVRERMLETLKKIDVPLINEETQLFPRDPKKVLGSFSIDSGARLIGIAPGAQHHSKRWSPERFAEAANHLAQKAEAMVLLLGDKNDRDAAQRILPLLKVPAKDLIGLTSIPELVAIISRLSFLLTNDSGLLHVGEALKVPLVALFGPTVRAFGFAPYRSTSKVVEVEGLQCRPCSLHGNDKCPLGHHRCMDDIDLTSVLTASFPLLGHPGGTSR